MLLDLQYIDHWSLAEDLSLIVKTVPVVVTGRGAS
jgi:lipopolysaccharide/colanic/teichoic acid biosynthesis glycosyltransferase